MSLTSSPTGTHASSHPSVLDEVVALMRKGRDDVALRLLELDALLVEGEIVLDDYVERKAALI